MIFFLNNYCPHPPVEIPIFLAEREKCVFPFSGNFIFLAAIQKDSLTVYLLTTNYTVDHDTFRLNCLSSASQKTSYFLFGRLPVNSSVRVSGSYINMRAAQKFLSVSTLKKKQVCRRGFLALKSNSTQTSLNMYI